MAQFSTDGIDQIAAEMAWMGERHGYRETGDMIESIRADKAPKSDANDVRRISVYPRGEDRKGVRNAEKVFLLHYGTSNSAKAKKRRAARWKARGKTNATGELSKLRMGTHWVDEAERDAGPMVQDVFEKIWDRHLKGG